MVQIVCSESEREHLVPANDFPEYSSIFLLLIVVIWYALL